jgi:hypothetical protein
MSEATNHASVEAQCLPLRTETIFKTQNCVNGAIGEAVPRVRYGAHWDAGNAAHAGQSSAGFCDSHVSIRQHEMRGRAGQHSSASAFACATQCSGHSLATQPTQGIAAQVSVLHTFECVSASWDVGQGSRVLRLFFVCTTQCSGHGLLSAWC